MSSFAWTSTLQLRPRQSREQLWTKGDEELPSHLASSACPAGHSSAASIHRKHGEMPALGTLNGSAVCIPERGMPPDTPRLAVASPFGDQSAYRVPRILVNRIARSIASDGAAMFARIVGDIRRVSLIVDGFGARASSNYEFDGSSRD